jgi:Acetyltransferases, including N-acetylases of ribosomal proteins
MLIDIGDIAIREFEKKDVKELYQIVNEENIVRFMRDWAADKVCPESFYPFIDWMQSQYKRSHISENKRYAVVLKATDELIGMVGMGLEDTLNEIELAYFMSEKHQRKGYTIKAVNAITGYCLEHSDIPYLILTIDCANTASCRLAEKCGYVLFEKRTPIGHLQPNMESDSYYYYRYYRK